MTQHWRNKVILVTGGSAGFGKALAETAARAGAKVVITGRDPERLQVAVQDLKEIQSECDGFAADVCDEEQVVKLFASIRERFGGLDVLVNNVGRSTRGLAAETTAEQYQDLWETNFLSAVRCTRAGLQLLNQSRGHLVFMGSLAAKSAARYLGAYPPSKFALAAYAQQLRLELADQGVHVLLVCPGPIARADHSPRYAAESQNLPESAQRPGGGVQVSRIEPHDLAQRILRACERRAPELVVPGKARLLFAIAQLFPSLGDWIVRRKT